MRLYFKLFGLLFGLISTHLSANSIFINCSSDDPENGVYIVEMSDPAPIVSEDLLNHLAASINQVLATAKTQRLSCMLPASDLSGLIEINPEQRLSEDEQQTLNTLTLLQAQAKRVDTTESLPAYTYHYIPRNALSPVLSTEPDTESHSGTARLSGAPTPSGSHYDLSYFLHIHGQASLCTQRFNHRGRGLIFQWH